MCESSFGQCPTSPMWSEKTEHPGGLGRNKRLTYCEKPGQLAQGDRET